MPSSERGGYLLLTLFLGVLMAALDIAVLGPAIPAVRAEFGIDERTVAWAFNTFVFFNLLGVPFMSKLADVFGRRRVYVIDVSLFATGALIVAVSPDFTTMLVGRAFQGVAASGIFPVAAAVVGDRYEAARRGRALGVLGAVFGIAFIIGPALAGVLLLVDWRLIYFSNLPLAAVVLVLAVRQLPDDRRTAAAPLDWTGLALLGLTLVCVAYAVNQLDTSDWAASLANPRVWLPLGVAVVALPVFVRQERTAVDPVVRPGLFRSRQVALASVLAAGAGLSESVFIFLPEFLVATFAVPVSTASFMLLPLMSAIAVTSLLAGRVLYRTGSRAVIVTCQALLAVGLTAVAVAGDRVAVFYAGSVLIGAGLAGILGPALSYILLHEARIQERTVSQGLITLFISVGQLIGGAAIGAVAASTGSGAEGYGSAFLVIAGVAGVVFLMAFGLKSRAAERAGLPE
jgi:MFS family permease